MFDPAGDSGQGIIRDVMTVLGPAVVINPSVDGLGVAEVVLGLHLVSDGGVDRSGCLGIKRVGEIAGGA